jgi:hypothetical protein
VGAPPDSLFAGAGTQARNQGETMNNVEFAPRQGSRMQIPRSRGAASGMLLIVLGWWGALIPFVGPYFDFAYSPDAAWAWTEARGWLEVLPGIVAVVGGLLLVTSRNRASAMLGGWLGVAAGVWFVVGRAFEQVLAVGDVGVPAAVTPAKTAALELTFFSGVGALMLFFAAGALGRLSIRSMRDIGYAQRRLVGPAADPVAVVDTTASQPTEELPRYRMKRRWRAGPRRHTPVAP